MEEVDNLVKILLQDYKARGIFCFGYIQKNCKVRRKNVKFEYQ